MTWEIDLVNLNEKLGWNSGSSVLGLGFYVAGEVNAIVYESEYDVTLTLLSTSEVWKVSNSVLCRNL